MSDFASAQDVINLRGAQSTEALSKINTLLPIASALIRTEADKRGKDMDAIVAKDSDMAAVAKAVTVDIVMRYVDSADGSGAPMSQMSQAAGGYSVSGTFLVPGGGLFIKNSELKMLGLLRQRYGVIDFYGEHD